MITVRGIKTILTELSEEDAEDVVKLRNDPANNKFLFQKPITVEDQVNWLRKSKNAEDAKNFMRVPPYIFFKKKFTKGN